MRISAIVPSYAERSCSRTIDSLSIQSPAPYEIILVRNGIIGKTKKLRKKGIFEISLEEKGLDLARNEGVMASSGDIVAFIDDDATAQQGWIEAIIKAHSQFKAPVIGGKIEAVWPGKTGKPSWIRGILLDYLSILDYSPITKEVDPRDWIAGTNISFKRNIFDEVGLFDENLDRRGDCLLSSGEEELCKRIRLAGHAIVYSPNMRVDHIIPKSRLTPDYFLKRAYWQGVSDLLIDLKYLQPCEIAQKIEIIREETKLRRVSTWGIYERVNSLCTSSRARGYLQAGKLWRAK